jgi:hypothetical protein
MPGPASSTATGDFWVFPATGTIQRQTNPLLRAALYEAGWYGFKTMAQAKAFAASNVITQTKQGVGGAVSATTGGLSDIGDFFHRITEAQTWTRVGEVVLGGILIYAGVRALSQGNAPVSAVTSAHKQALGATKRVASKAATVAVPEARMAGRTAAKRVAPKATARVAAHRAQVQKYGAKKPYKPPAPKPPTTRITHVYYHKAAGPKKPGVKRP